MDIKSRPSRSPIPRICTSSSSCLSMPSSRRSDHQAPAPHPGSQLLRYQCSNRNRDATGDANHSSYLWLKEMTQHGSVHRGLGHKGFTNESTFLHLRVSSHDSRPAEADKSRIYQKTCLSQLVPSQPPEKLPKPTTQWESPTTDFRLSGVNGWGFFTGEMEFSEKATQPKIK